MGAEVRRGMWELYSKDRKAGGDKLQILGRAEAGFKKKKKKETKARIIGVIEHDGDPIEKILSVPGSDWQNQDFPGITGSLP